jgi:hypothetical protein
MQLVVGSKSGTKHGHACQQAQYEITDSHGLRSSLPTNGLRWCNHHNRHELVAAAFVKLCIVSIVQNAYAWCCICCSGCDDGCAIVPTGWCHQLPTKLHIAHRSEIRAAPAKFHWDNSTVCDGIPEASLSHWWC